jgi:HAD superfamily hydrolase (TIGR01490 family)
MAKIDLVFWDIDDTVIDGASLWYLAVYAAKNGYMSPVALIKVWLWFIFYKLGLIDDPKKIMSRAVLLVRGRTVEQFKDILKDFFDRIILNKFYPEALAIIKKHKKLGRKIFLVSNSISPLVELFADKVGADYFIGTELERDNKNYYTGAISGDLTYGLDKVKKIKKYLAKDNILVKKSWAYSDHLSDAPLFQMANHAVVVNPKKQLLDLAEKRGWEIKSFSL